MAIIPSSGKVLAAHHFYNLHHDTDREDLTNIDPSLTAYERRTGLWVAIGKTTLWDSTDVVNCSYENLPPEYMDARNYEWHDLQGMKKCEECFHVRPDTTGEIRFMSYDSTAGLYVDTFYRTIAVDDIYDEDAHWIYLKFSLQYTELPITSFRQIGIFYNPELDTTVFPNAAGYGAVRLQPSQIAPVGTGRGPGILFYYSNIEARFRHEHQRDIIEVIIQF